MKTTEQNHRRSRLLALLALVTLTNVTSFQMPAPQSPTLRVVHYSPFVTSSPLISAPTTRLPLSSSSSSSSRLWMASTYEQFQEQLPSSKVIDAVVDLQRDSQVVASDVATRAGVSLSQARKDLTALASLSRGDISVSRDGELVYDFPSDLRGALSQNNAKFQALQTWQKVWPRLFWGIRVGFGVALLVSVVLIFTTLLFVQTSSSSSDDDRRRDDRGGGVFGGGNSMSMMWGPSPFDFFYYRPYGYYGYYGPEAKDPSEMGFLESVFSYIFGDGDPNQGIEERSLSLAAQMIRDNKGAVTAEQLAPFCSEAPLPDQRTTDIVDESFVLPIVTQLNGEPQVTEDGDIIYVFPELQVSASSSRVVPKASESAMILKRAGLRPTASAREIQQLLFANGISTRGILEKKELLAVLEEALPPMTPQEEMELFDADPSILQEREYQFSLAPGINKVLAGGLGVVNLGGALFLGGKLAELNMYGVQLPGILGLTQAIFPLLLTYAFLFNAIPLARNFWIQSQNAQIQQRNQARKAWRAKLQAKAGNVTRKLRAAARYATGRKQLGAQDIIFDTKTTSAADLGVTRNQNDLEEFDRLLKKEDENSAFQ